MNESILETVAKAVGIREGYDHFNDELIMHINTVLMGLRQIGVGPAEPFLIADSTSTWSNFLGDDKNFEAVKTYVCLRVRMLFDPPTSSTLADAMKNQIAEWEWRLNLEYECNKQKEGETNSGE